MLAGRKIQRGSHQNPLPGKRDFGWALWVDLKEAWALAAGLGPAVTCKKAWDSAGLLSSLVRFRMIGGLLTILLFALYLIVAGGLVLLHRLSSVPPFGLLLGCLLLIKVGVPSLSRFGGFGRLMMSLQFMSRQDALLLDDSLDADDVSRAWAVWFGAVESALADAYRFSGGPLPRRGLVLGRGSASFRVVRLGGHKVRKARGSAADAHDAADVFLYVTLLLLPFLICGVESRP